MSLSAVSRIVLIPSAVFLSVMFGGAFGSGREIVEFMTKHGPYGGLVSMAIIWMVWSTVLFLCFELARRARAYEYRSFFKVLLGRGWVLYEILIMMGLVVALAICASAAGTVFSDHFGIAELLGGVGLLSIVVGLTYFGRKIVEKSMILSVAALFLLLLYLTYLVVSNHAGDVAGAFQMAPIEGNPLQSGLKYAFSSAGFIPLLLYCARDLHNLRETFLAALCAGLVGILPGLPFHFAFMVGYPEILAQSLPTYWLIENIGTITFLNIYVGVLFVMIAQTGVGLLQGMVERVDGWIIERSGRPLPALGHACVSGGALVV